MYENKPIIKDIQIEGAQLLINYLSTNDLSHIPKVVNFKRNSKMREVQVMSEFNLL